MRAHANARINAHLCLRLHLGLCVCARVRACARAFVRVRGRVGTWQCGRVGVWTCGHVALLACGIVGVQVGPSGRRHTSRTWRGSSRSHTSSCACQHLIMCVATLALGRFTRAAPCASCDKPAWGVDANVHVPSELAICKLSSLDTFQSAIT
jgi:hypothetical protein